MKISVLTLFPEYFEPLMTTSILKRAKEKDLFEFETIDFRKFTKEKHGHVDDTALWWWGWNGFDVPTNIRCIRIDSYRK